MAVAAVSPAVLQRLSLLESLGQPVLSVYLDLDPSRFPTPSARDEELSALLSNAGARDVDAERAREAVIAHPGLAHGARAVAIFSCAAAGALEVLALPEPVEPLVVVDTVPWLEPLAAMVTTEDWGVAALSRRAARLFRGGAEGLVEFAVIRDEVHGRHAQGGWSQARFARGIEQQVAEHVRHATELLFRAHRRHPFDHLVIVASDELWPVVEVSLHRELHDRLTACHPHWQSTRVEPNRWQEITDGGVSSASCAGLASTIGTIGGTPPQQRRAITARARLTGRTRPEKIASRSVAIRPLPFSVTRTTNGPSGSWGRRTLVRPAWIARMRWAASRPSCGELMAICSRPGPLVAILRWIAPLASIGGRMATANVG